MIEHYCSITLLSKKLAVSQPDIPPVESGIESFSNVEMQSTQMDASVKGQLTQPTDVQAAHNYFQGGGTEMQTGLPDLSLDSGLPSDFQNSIDLGTNQSLFGDATNLGMPANGGEFATANMAGGHESALLQGLSPTGLEGGGLMPGLEQGVIAGMPPGSEPISPMIQMILKMPGLTGTVASFFEAIMSFLFPSDGGFFALLDPTMWAQTAQQAFGSLVTAISDSIPLSVSFIQSSSPFFSSLMNTGLLHNGLFESLGKTISSIQPPQISISGSELQPFDLNANNMFVNGHVSPGKPLFESGAFDAGGASANPVQVSGHGDLLAFDNGNSFGATMGGYTPNTGVDPHSITTQTASPSQTPQAELPKENLDGSQMDSTGAEPQRGEILDRASNSSLDSNSNIEIAENNISVKPGSYTVQSGDSLWNIAKEHFGSGNKWTDIYDLNSEVIGDNPNLIFSGSELQLPSVENIAQAHDYIVKPGDNLWNIAKDNLGSGAKWPHLYQHNADIIGSDPNLIHPGQHLAVSGNNPGSVQVAHHSAPQVHHSPKPVHHAKTSHGPAQPKPNHQQPDTSDTTGNTETLANQPQSDTAGDTILKEARNSASAAKDQLEKTKTANAFEQSPMGLKAVAKRLEI